MVFYCCVNECRNSFSNMQKEPGSPVTFFAFPTKQEQRLKWLQALGRPNWDPPATARVCNAHFKAGQLTEANDTSLILNDIVLDINSGLSPIVDIGLSDEQVCRICLATDVKMHSVNDGYLYTCMNGITGFNDTIKGLPQCVCYECAAVLMKSYRLVEKSKVAQTTLLDLYSNGPITYSVLNKQDRTASNLKSRLVFDRNVTDTFEYVDDDEDDTPLIFIKRDLPGSPKNETAAKTEDYASENQCQIEVTYVPEVISIKTDNNIDVDDHIGGDSDNDSENNDFDENNGVNDNYGQVENDDDEFSDIKYSQLDKTILEGASLEANTDDKSMCMFRVGPRKRKHQPKAIGEDGLTDDQRELQKYFKVVKLTLEEQIEDFQKSQKSKPGVSAFECDVCTRTFATSALLKRHMGAHDPNRGPAECAVCKHRYRNRGLVSAHAANAHGTRYRCLACPKLFRNIGMARKHRLEHLGLSQKCPHCSFRSAFEVSLAAHARYMHAHACKGGGCARGTRTHTHTRSYTHTDTRLSEVTKEIPEESSCKENRFKKSRKRKKPNDDLASPPAEGRTPRPRPRPRRPPHPDRCDANDNTLKKKKKWHMPGDSYPTKCEHCSTMLSCRKEHWAHVRRSHPEEKASYRSVITAVCEVCGQGFQNIGRLRLHELRHGQPTVPCKLCNKMFYDKFLLAIHMQTHSDARPFRCQTCGKGFKTRSNLDKHLRTHSDVAAYTCKLCGKKFKYSTSMNLHIRTVHHKIPLPPRKRKSRKSAVQTT